MPTRIRTRLAVEAERRNREQLARAGAEIRAARTRKRLTERELGRLVGLSQTTIGRAERGHGGGLTLDAWQRIGLALDRPLVVTFQRDVSGETTDAGHLAMRELVLRLGRAAGYAMSFELPTRPAEPWRSADVGGAARASERKRADAEALAVGRWGDAPHRVGIVWVVRASARNRALVGRYPEVFAARFPGSSRGWVRALLEGTVPPTEPGLIWCDLDATRLSAWRRR